MTVGDFPDLLVAVGEEGSDPVVAHEGRDHRVDEYARSGHLDRMETDLGDVAGLGVRVVRHGMPWRLAEPEPGTYDWSLWDRMLGVCDTLGLEPIVDLLHFGLPDHLPGFVDPAFVPAFWRYVDAFLARYPQVAWFTPVNEPGIHALMSARFGLWNDRTTGDDAYATALANVVEANLGAVARIRADRDGWWIGSEGFACHLVAAGAPPDAAETAREDDWLVWDLHLGHAPRGAGAAIADRIDARQIARIDALAVRDAHHVVAGHDVYPAALKRHGAFGPALPDPATVAATYADEARRWHARYGLDHWIAETSNLGYDADLQVPWLDAIAAVVEELRATGIPNRGICWYSRGDQFDWHTALTVPIGEITPVGLFTQDREARPSASAFAALAARWARA
ncbi:MAG: family 1 glycosylhydrolase [Actinomycetes bacterium]